MSTQDKEDFNHLVWERPLINPYRYAYGAVKDRLAWDMRAESWRSRARVKSFKDKYAGKKAVILCNGPSLLKVDFDSLKDIDWFGLNKVNLLFDNTSFRPSSVVAVNKLVIEQNTEFYRETDLPLFLDSAGLDIVGAYPHIAYLKAAPFLSFARDCSGSVYQGFTVTYVALQLAFHMGFESVALVGCDHSFASKGPSNKTVVAGSVDHSHFDPRYFSGGVKWQLPDLLQSEISYELARDAYAAYGRKLYNCTDGGLLEIFERRTLSEFLCDKG